MTQSTAIKFRQFQIRIYFGEHINEKPLKLQITECVSVETVITMAINQWNITSPSLNLKSSSSTQYELREMDEDEIDEDCPHFARNVMLHILNCSEFAIIPIGSNSNTWNSMIKPDTNFNDNVISKPLIAQNDNQMDEEPDTESISQITTIYVDYETVDLIITHWFHNIVSDIKINIIKYYPLCLWYIIRRCSSYANENLLLGIFTTKIKAENGKKEYIKITTIDDPYKNQPYLDVNLENDVIISKTEKFSANNLENVYVICEYGVGMGHISRNIMGWCAKEFFEKYFTIQHDINPIGNRFLVDIVQVNKIRQHNDNTKTLELGYIEFYSKIRKCSDFGDDRITGP